MIRPRVIPVLLLSGEKIVKTVRFCAPKYVGEPLNVLKIFNEKEVDEIVILDIDASKRGRSPNFQLIETMTSECFMPLAYGGGIYTIEQAKTLFSLGIEKVCVSSAAIEDINFIRRLADQFGSQAVTVVVNVKKNWLRKNRVFNSGKQRFLNMPPDQWVHQLALLGAGEIILNFIDHDGMGDGYDLACINSCAKRCAIPLVTLGGAGNLDHFKAAITHGASAVAAGSFFVFQGPHRAVMITYPNEVKLQQIFLGST